MAHIGIESVFEGIAAASGLVWVGLTFFRGDFWRFGPKIEDVGRCEGDNSPQVVAIVPARNEADLIACSLSSVRSQTYGGLSAVVLADDSSEDPTVRNAWASGGSAPLAVVSRPPLPADWSGKLWALQGGVEKAAAEYAQRKYYWFTDADIVHHPDALSRLVARAEGGGYGLVSTMVRLNVATWAEKLLIPPFVFFFAMLYPFAWVNRPDRGTAAAAGGSLLVSAAALDQIGGIESYRSALIDDCALAALVKRSGNPIWLGHSTSSRSVRAYSFGDIWRMVKRSAFAQLRHSVPLLLLTAVAMILTFLVPVATVFMGLSGPRTALGLAGGLIWLWMGACTLPVYRAYGLNPGWGFLLPFSAALYLAMTLDSALTKLFRGGSRWKGRSYGKK